MAERLPRARPARAAIADALTSDQPVKAQVATPKHVPNPTALGSDEWDVRFALFLERVMAQAAIGGDPKPFQAEYAELMKLAPPGKQEELENNRGKPPTDPTPKG